MVMCLPDFHGTHVPACQCERSALLCERFERWAKAARLEDVMQCGRYEKLLEAARNGSPHLSREKERQLQLDVERTWPSLSIFADGCSGRESLSNLLKAWIVYDGETVQEQRQQEEPKSIEAVGYVQGMNFIVMALLWHAGAEEAAFWLFVAMVHHYNLRGMFEPPDMHGLKVRSFTIAQLVQQEMPDLSAHLAEHLQNSLSLLFTEWLLTLFAGSLPLVPLAQLWDQFFEEGYTVIYRLILARLRCLRPWLLAETDFGALVHLVKNAHLDFVGPNGQPCPRPARQGLPGFVSPTTPAGETGARSPGPQPMTSRRRGLLRRLVRARDVQTVSPRRSSLPAELASSGARESETEDEAMPRAEAPSRPFCQSCEGSGSETCTSWERLVKDHLKAEVIDLARTAHYERMLAEPPTPLRQRSHEQFLEEENAALSKQNLQLQKELDEALRQLESLKSKMTADRLRSRLVLEACAKR